LSHWEPIEVVTRGAGNMVELSLAGDEVYRYLPVAVNTELYYMNYYMRYTQYSLCKLKLPH